MTCSSFVEDAGDELSLQALAFARATGRRGRRRSRRRSPAALRAGRLGDGRSPTCVSAALAGAVVAPGHRPRQRGAGARGRAPRPAAGRQLRVGGAGRPGDGDARALGREPARGGALHGAPLLLTVAPHAVAAEPRPRRRASSTPPSSTSAPSRPPSGSSTATGGVSLADADVVVSGGRGVGSAEGFAVIEELAELLGGAVGCSRAVTSAGWRPHTDQVGQTGTKISPEIYIACGISGATQHMAGCKGAKKLLAINPDGEASIFASADYAVIGDLHEVVPAIAPRSERRGAHSLAGRRRRAWRRARGQRRAVRRAGRAAGRGWCGRRAAGAPRWRCARAACATRRRSCSVSASCSSGSARG